jgi:anaerobic nitric oxide reductase transcription regulator
VLAEHFADAAARRLGVVGVRLTPSARRALVDGDWPGNVRELENVIGRSVLRASFGGDRRQVALVDASHLDMMKFAANRADSGLNLPAPAAEATTLAERLAWYERETIVAVVARHGGNWAAAARELGLHRSNLHHRAQRLGLKAR